eukprot:g2499.t1
MKKNTVKLALDHAVHLFQQHNIPEASLSALHLLNHAIFLDKSHTPSPLHKDLLSSSWQNQELDASILSRFDAFCKRRMTREPVQYIIGNWDFHSLSNLIVRAPILIPRPETEQFVDIVLENLQNDCNHSYKFLDIGSGTGAIGLALLKQLPNSECVAIDVNREAVELSLENARQQNVSNRYQCIKADIENFETVFHSKFDFVVSNPPYICKEEMSTLEPEVVLFEDERALCGDLKNNSSLGLDVVEKIIFAYPNLVREERKSLFLELGKDQPDILESWMKEKCLPAKVEKTLLDYAGNSRFAILGKQKIK